MIVRKAWLLALTLLGSGCQLFELDQQMQQAQQELVLVAGQVQGTSTGQPALVALLDSQGKPVAYRIVAPGSDFYFTAGAGAYQLLAITDHNHNFSLDPDEPRHWLPQARSAPLSLQPDAAKRAELARQNILQPSHAASFAAPALDLSLARLYRDNPRLRLNYLQQVSLDDPRFSNARVSQGAWQPLSFSREVGYGLYLLEPWDDQKEPVFLVHGINDSPRAWQALIDGLDRQRLQPVLFHYPGSLPLNNSAYLLSEAILDVQLRHAVRRFHIVAHSMGGLVARRTVQMLNAEGSRNLCLFLTLATPWNGHPAAATGLSQAPVIVPTWRDLAPGSAYLQALFATPLPAHVRQWLLVSYRGNSRLLEQPNDGVVPLASQLRSAAQDEAEHLYLLAENHTSILDSERSQSLINRALGELPSHGCR